jgi:hypothetical protein
MDVFPKLIGRWVRTGYRRYPNPHGYSVAYSLNYLERTTCTFYFYKGDIEGELEAGCNSAEVKEQFASIIQAIQENPAGTYQSIRQTEASQVLIGEGPHVRLALRAIFIGTTREAKTMLTQVYLTSTRFGFIKIRLSTKGAWDVIKWHVMSLFGQILSISTKQKDKIHAAEKNDDDRVLAAPLIM